MIPDPGQLPKAKGGMYKYGTTPPGRTDGPKTYSIRSELTPDFETSSA